MWPSRMLELLTPLIAGLCEERGIDVPAPTSVDEMWEQFRALVNAPAHARLAAVAGFAGSVAQ